MKTNQLLMLLVVITLYNSCKKIPKEELELITQPKKMYQQEKFRPQFHFTPKEKWMNDPNGMVYYNEYYHLFYQYYPDSTVWGPMHWGHAKSKDLLHWEHLPIALYPDSLGYIFSGSAVIDKHNTAGFGKNAMIALYTYHDPVGEKAKTIDFQTQGLAYSLDEGLTWTKYEGNPIIKNPGIRDFRDPKVFWNDDTNSWQMVLVAKDHVQIYDSQDLKSWEKLSDFKFEDNPPLGVWECPDLFKLKVEDSNEEKWVMIISHGTGAPNGGSGTRYFVGDYDGKTFTTNQKESIWLDYGTDNYAGVTWNDDPNNERIFIGWMSNWDYAIYTPTKSWRSAMTLPRKLTLHNINGKYIIKNIVIDKFNSLLSDKVLTSKKSVNKIDFSHQQLQNSRITFDATTINDFQIKIANDSNEALVLGYKKSEGLFYIDRTKSGMVDFKDKFIAESYQTMIISDQSNLSFDIILDASSIEVFINNGEYVMTNQIFPNAPYSNIAISGTEISNFKVYAINSIY